MNFNKEKPANILYVCKPVNNKVLLVHLAQLIDENLWCSTEHCTYYIYPLNPAVSFMKNSQ